MVLLAAVLHLGVNVPVAGIHEDVGLDEIASMWGPVKERIDLSWTS